MSPRALTAPIEPMDNQDGRVNTMVAAAPGRRRQVASAGRSSIRHSALEIATDDRFLTGFPQRWNPARYGYRRPWFTSRSQASSHPERE
jgi:hypothetical protein